MRVLLLLWLWLCLSLPAWALDEQPIPELTDRVIDQTGTLSDGDRKALVAKLAAFEKEAGPQIVVLLVRTTAPEDHVAYAHRVADHWKIGRKSVGDGLLILVVKDDRKIRIEVAKALEGAIPDLAARQIIQKQISPAFKAGDFAKGLNDGIDALQARIRGEHLPTPEPAERSDNAAKASDGLGLEEIAALFFIGVPIIGAVVTGIFGRKLGSMLTAGGVGGLTWLLSTSVLLALGAGLVALLMVGVMGIGATRRGGLRGRHDSGIPPIFWGGGGSGGSSWGGGDGGGFSSGGGGDFGGGGASGDW